MKVISDFMWNNTGLKVINTSYITLIPKVKDPEKGEQLRPISCSNFVYKVIANFLLLDYSLT